MTDTPSGPKPRGFATMTPEERTRISRLGGKAAHAAGTAHKFDSEEGRRAGQLGGKAAHRARGRTVEPAERGETTGNVPNTTRDA